jgi:hypothetical protein
VLEVHTVDPGDEGQREEDRRHNREQTETPIRPVVRQASGANGSRPSDVSSYTDISTTHPLLPCCADSCRFQFQSSERLQ